MEDTSDHHSVECLGLLNQIGTAMMKFYARFPEDGELRDNGEPC